MNRDERSQLVLALQAGLTTDGDNFVPFVDGQRAAGDAVVAEEGILVHPDTEDVVVAHVVAVDHLVLVVLGQNVDQLLEYDEDVVGHETRV